MLISEFQTQEDSVEQYAGIVTVPPIHPQMLTGKISLRINSRKDSSFEAWLVGAGDQFAVDVATSVCCGPGHGKALEMPMSAVRGKRSGTDIMPPNLSSEELRAKISCEL